MVTKTNQLLATLLFGATLCMSCTKSNIDSQNDDFDRSSLLLQLSNQVVLPTLREFENTVPVLMSSVQNYCAALGSGSQAAKLLDAQESWTHSMLTWQKAESMNIGPAHKENDGIRDEIFSWNITSPCSVDQATLAYRQNNLDVSAQLPNRRGLDALEYLLFTGSTDHSCTSTQSTPEGWSALSEDEVSEARCNYALAVTEDISLRIDNLLSAWSEGDSFSKELYSMPAKEAVDKMALALTYLEHIKELKIEKPIGITENSCFTTETIGVTCPQDLESPLAKVSMESISANFEGFISFFTGNDGLGFDDMLVELGSPEVSESILRDANAALAIAKSFEEPFYDLLGGDKDSLLNLHTEVQSLNTTLKSQFLSVTGISLPDLLSDND